MKVHLPDCEGNNISYADDSHLFVFSNSVFMLLAGLRLHFSHRSQYVSRS